MTSKLINDNIIKHPPIVPKNTIKPMPKLFDQYHCQPEPETQNNYALKNVIQDLIDSNAISIDVEVNSTNKSLEYPNKNFKIYINHFTLSFNKCY